MGKPDVDDPLLRILAKGRKLYAELICSCLGLRGEQTLWSQRSTQNLDVYCWVLAVVHYVRIYATTSRGWGPFGICERWEFIIISSRRWRLVTQNLPLYPYHTETFAKNLQKHCLAIWWVWIEVSVNRSSFSVKSASDVPCFTCTTLIYFFFVNMIFTPNQGQSMYNAHI